MISALVDVGEVWDSVVARNRTGHVIYVLDRSGQIFASTDPVAARPGLDASRSELVARFLSAGRRARETLPFIETVDAVEVQQLGSYEVTDQGWGIFVQARLDDVYIPVQYMVRSAVRWAMVVLGVAVIGAAFFAGTLSKPIKRLAAASR